MIVSLITQTLLIVLFLTFSFGPAFFALINIGLKHGYKTGALLALGVVLSDLVLCIIIIFLVHFGATNLIKDEKNLRFMGIVAGVILIIFGSLYFKKPLNKSDETVEIKAPSSTAMLLKGFFLNILNPVVWLLWLGNVTAVGSKLNYSIVNMIIYFSITLGLVLLVELAKIVASTRLKQFLTERIMLIINRVTGILLILFGSALIYNHFFGKL